MKIGAVVTEIALLIVKKEEINASKIDSPSASLPSGLNNPKEEVMWCVDNFPLSYNKVNSTIASVMYTVTCIHDRRMHENSRVSINPPPPVQETE